MTKISKKEASDKLGFSGTDLGEEDLDPKNAAPLKGLQRADPVRYELKFHIRMPSDVMQKDGGSGNPVGARKGIRMLTPYWRRAENRKQHKWRDQKDEGNKRNTEGSPEDKLPAEPGGGGLPPESVPNENPMLGSEVRKDEGGGGGNPAGDVGTA